MLVYLPSHEGTCAARRLASTSDAPGLSLSGASASPVDATVTSSPAGSPAGFVAVASVPTTAAAGDSPCLLTAAASSGASAIEISSTDISAVTASRAAPSSVSRVADTLLKRAETQHSVPHNFFHQKERPVPGVLPSASITVSFSSASPCLLPSGVSTAASSHTDATSSAASVPVAVMLDFPAGSPALLPSVEIEAQLQAAFTAAGVHTSPYVLQCLRRHILRSLLASLRHFLPPLLPPALLRPPVFSCVGPQRDGGRADSGLTSLRPARELPFHVAPDEVVHLTFQSWKNFFFLPVDSGAAAVVGLIPSCALDAAAAAALAACSCVAIEKRRGVLSVPAAGVGCTRRAYYSLETAAGAAARRAAHAGPVNSSGGNGDVHRHDGEELSCCAKNCLGRDAALFVGRRAHLAAHDRVMSAPSVAAPLLQRPLPRSFCSREAAFRAMAYWSCLAELQEVELQHQQPYPFLSGRVSKNVQVQGADGAGDNGCAATAPAFSSTCDRSSIRLLQQLKQSFDSVMRTVLQRQQDALDQLRERQSLEMEEASGRKELLLTRTPAGIPAAAALEVTSPGRESAPAVVASAFLPAAGAAPFPGTAAAALHPSGGALPARSGSTATGALRSAAAANSQSSVAQRCQRVSLQQEFGTARDSLISKSDAEAVAGAEASEQTQGGMAPAAQSTRLVDGRASCAGGVVNRVDIIFERNGMQNGGGRVSLTEERDSRTPSGDTTNPCCSHSHGGDSAERKKVEALVLQHVSEFQLVELHWKAESLLLRRQQLQDLKNVAVDLVLLRRAARQGHLSSPLALPPLPSAFEGDVIQLLPQRAQLTSSQTRPQADTGDARRGAKQGSTAYAGSGEHVRQGKNVSIALRTLFGSSQHRQASADNVDNKGIQGSLKRPHPPQADALQLQKSVGGAPFLSDCDAETKEIQRLLDIYLPVPRRLRKARGNSVGPEEEAFSQVLPPGPRGGASAADGGPLLPVVQPRKPSTEGERQRPPTGTTPELDALTVPRSVSHPQVPSSMREPLPAALQLITPTKLLRNFLQHQQQRRRTVGRQAKSTAQELTAQCKNPTHARGSKLSLLEEGNAEGSQSHGAATAVPKKTMSSILQLSGRSISEQSGHPKETEARRLAHEEMNFGDLAQLEAWENVVKSWAEERALEKLQQHAFLPLVFGQQRKRSVVIRVCSGSVTDIVVPNPQDNGACGKPNFRTTPAVACRNSDGCPLTAGEIPGGCQIAAGRAAAGLRHAHCTGGGYDYCSGEIACPPEFSDRLFSKVLLSCQADCCSLCRPLPGTLSPGSKQPAKPFSRSSLEGDSFARAVPASGAPKHSCGKFGVLGSAEITTLASEPLERSAATDSSWSYGTPSLQGKGNDAAVWAAGDSWNRDLFSQNGLSRDPCSSSTAGSASVGLASHEKSYVVSSEISSPRDFSPFAMLGPGCATADTGAVGMILAVGSSLKLVAPTHLRWESHLSETTDFVFPTLDEQRQMLYRTLFQQQYYGQLLYSQMRGEPQGRGNFEKSGEDASKRGSPGNCGGSALQDSAVYPMSVHCCTPSRCVPRLHLGDIFISRHSNSGPVRAAFHLVVREEKNPEPVAVSGEHVNSCMLPVSVCENEEAIPSRVLQGVGEVLRLCTTEGVRTLLLPLLLLEGEAAVCSFTYARLQQRALQVVRYIVNEVKHVHQSSASSSDLSQIVLVLPPMPANAGSARATPRMRVSRKSAGADVERHPTCVATSENMHTTADVRDSPGCVRTRDFRISEDGVRRGEQDTRPPHPIAALRKGYFPENCWMETVLKSVIAYLTNCGHCWVGQRKCRQSCRISPA